MTPFKFCTSLKVELMAELIDSYDLSQFLTENCKARSGADHSLLITKFLLRFVEENKNPIAVWANIHQRGVNHIAIDRSSEYLISLGEDRNMCLFDIRDKDNLPEKPFMLCKGIHRKAPLSASIGKENKF